MAVVITAKELKAIRDKIPAPIPAKKENKYKAIKTTVDGIKFDSTHESERYGQLKLLQRAGRIKDLQLQVAYPIVINEVKVCKYIADFVYIDEATGEVVVEDAKSEMTRKLQVYRLKHKLMKAVHGITIREV